MAETKAPKSAPESDGPRNDWVHITHPAAGDSPNPVTRGAFNAVWRHRGWTIKEEAKK